MNHKKDKTKRKETDMITKGSSILTLRRAVRRDRTEGPGTEPSDLGRGKQPWFKRSVAYKTDHTRTLANTRAAEGMLSGS